LDVKKNPRVNAGGAPRLDEMFFARFKVNESCVSEIINKLNNSISEYPDITMLCNGTHREIKDKNKFLSKLKDIYGFSSHKCFS